MTLAEDRLLAAYIKTNGSARACARELRVARGTVQDAIRRMKDKGIKFPVFDKREQVEEATKASEEWATLFKERAREKKELMDKAKEKEFKDQIKELSEDNEDMSKKLEIFNSLENVSSYRIPDYAPTSGMAVPVVLLSDVHCGERVDLADVPGATNMYNPEISRKRCDEFFQRSLYLTNKVARTMAKVDTLVLGLLGDLMTGYLHDDQKESNFMSPNEECLFLEEMISSGIEYLLQKGDFKKLIIPCVVGNHSRSCIKPRAKTLTENSFEWLVYKHLERLWSKEKRVEMHVAHGYHQYLRLYDTTLRFHHGDAVKYGGGVGGITVPLLKAIASWNTIQRADVDCLGHWHQFLDGGSFVTNGSVVGYGAYSLQIKARYEPPQQAFFLVDKTRGKTLTARIFTDYLPEE